MPRFPIALALFLAALPAQTPAKPTPTRESALDAKVVEAMLAFARRAESAKMPSRAQAIYEEILAHYDNTNRTSLLASGWHEVKGAWQPPTEPKRTSDAATTAQRSTVQKDEQNLRRQCAALHRELGVALLGENELARGRYQLERALAHDPGDVAAHKALGHAELDGFWGSDEDLAFVRRFREIAAKATELRGTSYTLSPLDPAGLPAELHATGVPMTGARSEHFTMWTDGAQDVTDGLLQQAERCLALLQFLVGTGKQTVPVFDSRLWLAVVQKREPYIAFVDANTANLRYRTAETAKQLSSAWIATKGRLAECFRVEPDVRDDAVVANVVHRSWADQVNGACGEGMSHALTWLLCGTVHTEYMQLPATTTGRANQDRHRNDPQEWLLSLRADVAAGKDLRLLELVRERADNFRPKAHRKAWLFMLWLPARHPERWSNLIAAMREAKDPEQCAQAIAEALGRPAAEVDEEWRTWARGDQPIAKATGLGR